MTEREALERILELAYAGHPDGREARLEMIRRIAKSTMEQVYICRECEYEYTGSAPCPLCGIPLEGT